jgi:cytochrome c2
MLTNRFAPAVLLGLFSCLLCVACTPGFLNPGQEYVPGGDPKQGEIALYEYGCGACHVIPGIPGAEAYVGPPLINWAERAYIAGNLTNTPDSLILWLQNPQAIEPGTVMPDLDVTEEDARDMSAYLFSLRED